MGMDHGFQIGPHGIDGAVERQFGGRSVLSQHRAIRFYTDNVALLQRAFVNGRRCDPDISLFIHDGEIAAGGGRKSFVIDPLHEHNQLFRRMNCLDIH